MRLAIGISTMNDGISLVEKNLESLDGVVDVIICHQITNDKKYNYDGIFNRSCITVVSKYEKGLSRSRNVLLDTAYDKKYDYLIISDDDVKYKIENLEKLIIFLSKDENKKNHYQFKSEDEFFNDRKSYRNTSHKLNLLDIFKVSSIEMCLNVELIKKYNIKFDEKFGLGGVYPVAEEAVLLSDIFRNKQSVIFIPISITIHPIESTGNKLFINKSMIEARGAMFRRCAGSAKGILLMLLFWIKKFVLRKKQSNEISTVYSLKLLFEGYLLNGK